MATPARDRHVSAPQVRCRCSGCGVFRKARFSQAASCSRPPRGFLPFHASVAWRYAVASAAWSNLAVKRTAFRPPLTSTLSGRNPSVVYFPDLTPYAYGSDIELPGLLNVGWLSAEHPFPRGSVPEEFLRALEHLVQKPVNLTRGSHLCEFCPEPPVTIRNGFKWIQPAPGTAGNGEVHIAAGTAESFAAPVLVLHYVQVHGYCPPPRFIVAVLAQPAA